MTDKLLAEWWDRLGAIAVSDDGTLLQEFSIPEAGQSWKAGADREEVWDWFDRNHSKGVYALMFPVDSLGERYGLVKAFLIEWYKHDRLYGRGEEYGDLIVHRAAAELQRDGYGCISQYESKTGEAIWYRLEDGSVVILTDDSTIKELLRGRSCVAGAN